MKLSTFSLLLEKQDYKNLRRFLYLVAHTKFVLILSEAQFPAVSLEELHFKMLSWPVRNVANYASRKSAISLPMYHRIQICFLYRNNRTHCICFLKLYTADMKFS